MGRYLQSRGAEIVVPEPSWRKISRGRFGSWPKTKNGSQIERNSAPTNATSASLRSENDERSSAVEMTPRGKRGKLKNQRRLFHSFHRAWKSGQNQNCRISTFPPRRRRLLSLAKDKT